MKEDITAAAILNVLGRCIAGEDANTLWNGYSSKERQEMLKFAAVCNCRKLLYYCLGGQIFGECAREAKIEFIVNAANAESRENIAIELERFFKDNNIDFRFVKGMSLCRSVYPERAIRYSVDIDVLVKQEDAVRVFELLKARGAKPDHEYLDRSKQHLPRLSYKKNFIELHTYLFDGEEGENKFLWQEFERRRDNVELILLHVLHHSIIRHFFLNGISAIIDVGYILRQTELDMSYFHYLEEKLKSHGLLDMVICSFPEFFAGYRELSENDVPQEVCRAMRNIVFKQNISNIGKREIETVCFHQKKTFDKISHIISRLKLMTPSYFAYKYRTTKFSANCLFPFYFLREVVCKMRLYLREKEKLNSENSKSDIKKIDFIMTLHNYVYEHNNGREENTLNSFFK